MWKQIKELWGLWLMLAASIAIGLMMAPWQWAKRPGTMKYGEYQRERQKELDAGETVSCQEVFEAPAFSFLDSDGNPFGSRDLGGHVYVADFIFTHCQGTCPALSNRMATLQKQLANPQIQLVSFSVDPAHDRPAVLKEYASRFAANPARWHFLATQPGPLADLLAGFHLPADQPIAHSNRLFLVDDQGRVRGSYDGLSDDEMKNLLRDVRGLVGRDAPAASASPATRPAS